MTQSVGVVTMKSHKPYGVVENCNTFRNDKIDNFK